jgi:rubrerythrin
MKVTMLFMLLVTSTFLSVTLGAFQSPDDGAADIKSALDRAIDDERHAIAFYTAVMATHGERRPFSNIINAERRHEAALLEQYQRLELEVPENRWSTHTFEIHESFAEVCDSSAVAEIRNGRMYDDLIDSCGDPIVRDVFDRLRWASVERHLRALRRHGSGWAAVEAEALSPEQQSQRDEAVAAKEALFEFLFAELSSAMAGGDPAAAIDVCATRAGAIASEVSDARGLRIGRTSFKLRNPANTPPVWADLALDDQPETPLYFADQSGRLGALLPIRLASSCVQCHGSDEEIAPETRMALDQLYPGDNATGFADGDLRGWFWVEVPTGGD